MRNSLRCLVAATILFGALGANAQLPPTAEQPPPDQIGGLRFVDTTEVTLINVDVTVTDRRGNPVTDLTPEDFEVIQNGERQVITNFAVFTREGRRGVPSLPTLARQEPEPAESDAEEEPAADDADAAAQEAPADSDGEPDPAWGIDTSWLPEREPRYIVVYVDNENLHPFNRNRIINQTVEWVRNQLAEPDQMMVVSYQRSLTIQQRFTSDPDAVIAALRSLRTYTGGRTEVNSYRERVEGYIEEGMNRGDGRWRAMEAVRGFAREQRHNLTFAIRASQEIVTMMSGLPGKKILIHISDGLPWSPGLELFNELQEQYQDASAFTYARDYEASDLFRGLVTTAISAGVTFYPVDARGLEAGTGVSAESRQPRSPFTTSLLRTNYQDSLIYMAEQTGGMAVLNANDVRPGLERMVDRMETYYWIGYPWVPTGRDRLHRIDVRIPGRPDLQVNFRRSYMERSAATQVGDRVMSGLVVDMDENALGVALTSGDPTPATAGRWLLPVEVRIPWHRVALIPDGEDLVGHLMVYYAARDDEGQQSDLQQTEHVVRIPMIESVRGNAPSHVVISSSMLLEDGRYRLSVGVRDQLTNQSGYATGLARVPALTTIR